MTNITVVSCLPPPILQNYEVNFLLDPLERLLRRVENEIIPRSLKKIRKQDIGRQREFDILLKKFRETYERKKNEKNEYHKKTQEERKKRSYISNTSGPLTFRKSISKK